MDVVQQLQQVLQSSQSNLNSTS